VVEFCTHESHGGGCQKTGSYCNLGACPYEELREYTQVAHGKWERRRSSWYCTNCGRGYKIAVGTIAANRHNYCPNCGAKMDGTAGK
jgi:DNA-directed RNA polymerase subunit RPC12/RpoP